jgi:hypothetical protein
MSVDTAIEISNGLKGEDKVITSFSPIYSERMLAFVGHGVLALYVLSNDDLPEGHFDFHFFNASLGLSSRLGWISSCANALTFRESIDYQLLRDPQVKGTIELDKIVTLEDVRDIFEMGRHALDVLIPAIFKKYSGDELTSLGDELKQLLGYDLPGISSLASQLQLPPTIPQTFDIPEFREKVDQHLCFLAYQR